MAIDADRFEGIHSVGLPIQASCRVHIDTKFILAQSGRNIGVRARIDVRVDPYRDGGNGPRISRDLGQHMELGFGLDIEALDAELEASPHLRSGFANPRKNNFDGIAASGYHAFQLAERDHVKARPKLREHVEHREVRVGFHGITDQVRSSLKCLLVGQKSALDGLVGVDVGRCAVATRDGLKRYPLAVQCTVDVRKSVHQLPEVVSSRSAGRNGPC